MNKKHGKDAIKVGDKLFGFYHGAHQGYPKFKEVEIAKVGRKYIYGLNDKKLEMTFDNRWYPQANEQLATDSDGYKYYKTLEAAKRGYDAKSLAIQLNGFNFTILSDRWVFEIFKLLKLKLSEED